VDAVIARIGLLAFTAVAQVAVAQPSEPPPLAQIRDDKQLAAVLAQLTNDPAVPVTDPALRQQAQALMIEGVHQLQTAAFEQALANFLEAYAKYPSPKILLNIATTLLEMGRPADAANTYQRYLADPASGTERVAEVKELLVQLDAKLTILTIRIDPRGSDISIDGGPFIAVGTSLVTRVRPGIHLARIRHGLSNSELSINGFEGENKEVKLAVAVEAAVAKPPPPPGGPRLEVKPPPAPPEHQDGWLITAEYKSDGTGNRRGVIGASGDPVAAITPAFDILDDGIVQVRRAVEKKIASGAVGALRIDAAGRGFAGAIGLAVSWDRFEGDLMYLRSTINGAYLGLRVRILTGFLRPYVAAGLPAFVFDHRPDPTMVDIVETRLAVGARVAAGLELYINGHLSVQGDFGYEHFWFVKDTRFIADLWVPTLGIIGRL
jgi:hypothetical protein